MDIKKLNGAIEGLKEDLGKALVGCDLWESGVGQPIASFNTQPKATALFDSLTVQIRKMLKGAEFPDLDKFYSLDIENDLIAIVIQINKYQLGMLVNSAEVNMGILYSIAIPNVRKAVEEGLK